MAGAFAIQNSEFRIQNPEWKTGRQEPRHAFARRGPDFRSRNARNRFSLFASLGLHSKFCILNSEFWIARAAARPQPIGSDAAALKSSAECSPRSRRLSPAAA